MSNRLTKLYTRTGDDGSTGLADGLRTPKHSLRMHAIGTVDELNSHIGLLRAYLTDKTNLDSELNTVQHLLFNLGGQLAMPDYKLIEKAHTVQLENWLDAHNESLPSLKDFILPAGSVATAQAHVCRSVCRRAERDLVALHETESTSKEILTFINRLSDYLFVLARVVARQHGGAEVLWDKQILDNAKP